MLNRKNTNVNLLLRMRRFKKHGFERPDPRDVVKKWLESSKTKDSMAYDRLAKLNDLIRIEIKHEDTMISNRMTALAISQSFFINAFVQSSTNLNKVWIAYLGIGLCVINALSIQAAWRTADYYRALLMELKKEEEQIFNFVGKRPALKLFGYIYAIAAPLFIIGFWIAGLSRVS